MFEEQNVMGVNETEVLMKLSTTVFWIVMQCIAPMSSLEHRQGQWSDMTALCCILIQFLMTTSALRSMNCTVMAKVWWRSFWFDTWWVKFSTSRKWKTFDMFALGFHHQRLIVEIALALSLINSIIPAALRNLRRWNYWLKNLVFYAKSWCVKL